VIERWRSASMSHRMSEDDSLPDYGSPPDAPSTVSVSDVTPWGTTKSCAARLP